MAKNNTNSNPTIKTEKEELQTPKKPEKLVIGVKKIKVLVTLRGSYGAYDTGSIVEVDARDAENFVKAHAAEYVEE